MSLTPWSRSQARATPHIHEGGLHIHETHHIHEIHGQGHEGSIPATSMTGTYLISRFVTLCQMLLATIQETRSGTCRRVAQTQLTD